MSCTVIPDLLQDLLATVAAHLGIPADQLGPEQYDVAVAYGWVYEHRGRVGFFRSAIDFADDGLNQRSPAQYIQLRFSTFLAFTGDNGTGEVFFLQP